MSKVLQVSIEGSFPALSAATNAEVTSQMLKDAILGTNEARPKTIISVFDDYVERCGVRLKTLFLRSDPLFVRN